MRWWGISRVVVVAAFAALLTLGVVACGDDEDTTTQSAASTQAEPTNGDPKTADRNGSDAGEATSGGDSRQPDGDASEQPDGSAPSSSRSEAARAAAQRDSGGGSGQFRVPGGDNSIQEFGAEASDAEREEAAIVLHAFLAAHADQDWATVCSYLSQRMLDQLEQLVSGSPELKGTGCPAAVDALLVGATPAERAELTQADVGSLRVEGDRAFLLYRGSLGRDYAILLEREDGAWKAAALLPTAFPEAS